MLTEHLGQTHRVRGRTRDRIDAELANGADQQLRRTRTKGDHQRTGGLKAKVIRKPAHPQLVVKAVHHRVARPEPRG